MTDYRDVSSTRKELIQVAAVAMATISIIDKQSTHLAFDTPEYASFDSDYQKIAVDVAKERIRQEKKWGVRYDDDEDVFWWLAVLGEEVGEACQAALETKAQVPRWSGWPEKAVAKDPCNNCGCPLGDHDPDTMLCFGHPGCPGHDPIVKDTTIPREKRFDHGKQDHDELIEFGLLDPDQPTEYSTFLDTLNRDSKGSTISQT